MDDKKCAFVFNASGIKREEYGKEFADGIMGSITGKKVKVIDFSEVLSDMLAVVIGIAHV